MNFKEKVLNFYENPEKFKEHRWIMLLVICGLTVSKDFIKRIIGANTYNIIIPYIKIVNNLNYYKHQSKVTSCLIKL